MNTKDFYVKLIDDMRASFESEYSKETIEEWKNGFEYRWYDEHGSKYNSLLSKYVRDNLYQYVINATKNSSIEDKQEIFEFLYLFSSLSFPSFYPITSSLQLIAYRF